MSKKKPTKKKEEELEEEEEEWYSHGLTVRRCAEERTIHFFM